MPAFNPLSLFELNALARQAIEQRLQDSYWVQAELSEVRSVSSGHCYVEFVQKNDRGTGLVAKARGIIYRNIFSLLKPYFEQTTGQPFEAGIKVLVEVGVSFHELYGYSLEVRDIDPSYTLGDMKRRRQEILRQLAEEGVLDLNKELSMPMLPQRVAVISSATAAGYGDFCDQLLRNQQGYGFKIELFQALMQGDGTEKSVLNALDAIFSRENEFDVVVIIRGGGATSELSAFDSYNLAAAVAQYPLPVITGIGHDRDDTILDIVSHTRVKTPTAAAEYLIGRMDEAASVLADLKYRLRTSSRGWLSDQKIQLSVLRSRLPLSAKLLLKHQYDDMGKLRLRLAHGVRVLIERQYALLKLQQQRVADASPDKMLRRGYSITFVNGHVLKNASEVKAGDMLLTQLSQGTVQSVASSSSDENYKGTN